MAKRIGVSMTRAETRTASALRIVNEQLEEAIASPKCHACGCLQQTVEALAATETEKEQLAPVLEEARNVFLPRKYDCLGCALCYPAIAANAFAEAYPEASTRLELCPTEEPTVRHGWPPLPGDYSVVRYRAPVAVCALNSQAMVTSVAMSKPEGLAIIGTMHTENLGIERVIRNTLSNPHIRFLLLCGSDTKQAVGHLPGQSLESLFQNGLDHRGLIIGAKGKRPVLKNVSRDEVSAFKHQVELVSMIGEECPETVATAIRSCAERNPGANPRPFKVEDVERIEVRAPERLTLDKAGYFVVYPDSRAKRLVVEHYTNQGLLNCVLEGTSPGALYGEAIERQLVTLLDHAAYLGQELARAERSLVDGTPFVQDAAPGEVASDPSPNSCGPGQSCCCTPSGQTMRQIKGCC